MALLWKATAMQTNNVIVNAAKTRAEAMTIVNKSIDRWEELIMWAADQLRARAVPAKDKESP